MSEKKPFGTEYLEEMSAVDNEVFGSTGTCVWTYINYGNGSGASDPCTCD